MWTALAPAGLPALLSLGGDGAALPADGGRVDRSRAPVRRCQGVHHPEVRAACAQEGCGAEEGGTVSWRAVSSPPAASAAFSRARQVAAKRHLFPSFMSVHSFSSQVIFPSDSVCMEDW